MIGTADLVERDRAHVWHPYTQMATAAAPLPIVRGEGVYLYTADGRRILDAISSWWVNVHGHSHPALNAAIAHQVTQLEQVIFAGCTHSPAVELAEGLVNVLPAGLTRVFYSDNGSTAVEVALKLAMQYWGNKGEARRTFVTLHHAYHGDTAGAMSVSAESIFTLPFRPMLFDVVRAHSPYCYRCPLGLTRESCAIDCLADLERCLREASGPVAAVLVEPMLQGAGGMIVWPSEFLAGVRRLCDAYGVLMIADEVLTGFGRTGEWFACQHAGVVPDIICLSKALTGGYLPLGATVTTDEVFNAFLSTDRGKTFFHGHSFSGNPLACAVGVASLKLLHETDAVARVRRLGAQMQGALQGLRSLPIVGDVRVLGGVGIVELVSDKATKRAGGYLDDLGPRLASGFIERGLLLRPLGNILYFMPPYVIRDDEAAWALEQVREVLEGLVP